MTARRRCGSTRKACKMAAQCKRRIRFCQQNGQSRHVQVIRSAYGSRHSDIICAVELGQHPHAGTV